MVRDPADLRFRVVELERRLANVLRWARVDTVDAGGALLTAAFDDDEAGEPVSTGPVPWLAAFAGDARAWRAPSVGEQVLLLSPDGDLAQAVALPAGYSDARPAPSGDPAVRLERHPDGAVLSYDAGRHVLMHTAHDGAVVKYDAASHLLSAVLPGEGTTTLDSRGGVNVLGDVAVTGSIAATGEVSDEDGSMQEMRDTYNTHTHPAANPPAQTGAATQQMN